MLLILNGSALQKGTVKKIKRQAIDQEKIFASHMFHKEFLLRLYRNIFQLNKKANNVIFFKWANYLNKHFTKEDI